MDIALRRLHQQRRSQNLLVTPSEIFDWLGVVQVQEYLGVIITQFLEPFQERIKNEAQRAQCSERQSP